VGSAVVQFAAEAPRIAVVESVQIPKATLLIVAHATVHAVLDNNVAVQHVLRQQQALQTVEDVAMFAQVCVLLAALLRVPISIQIRTIVVCAVPYAHRLNYVVAAIASRKTLITRTVAHVETSVYRVSNVLVEFASICLTMSLLVATV